MNGWLFINSFFAGFIHGVTFSTCILQRPDEEQNHPAYTTAWIVGLLMGIATIVSVILHFFG